MYTRDEVLAGDELYTVGDMFKGNVHETYAGVEVCTGVEIYTRDEVYTGDTSLRGGAYLCQICRIYTLKYSAY